MEEVEVWKDIEDFGRYKVSNMGEVLDTIRNKLVAKQLTGKPQYYYVNMNRDDGERKLLRVHILVAKAFIPNTENLEMVDHKDQNKLNNSSINLRWVNRTTNARNKTNDFFIEYDGGRHLLIDLIYNQYGENRRMYQYIYKRVTIYKEDYNQAVLSWTNRKARTKAKTFN